MKDDLQFLLGMSLLIFVVFGLAFGSAYISGSNKAKVLEREFGITASPMEASEIKIIISDGNLKLEQQGE